MTSDQTTYCPACECLRISVVESDMLGFQHHVCIICHGKLNPQLVSQIIDIPHTC